MISNEELREALFDLEQARFNEEKNRLASDCLLEALYVLTQPKNELSLFNELLNTLQKAIPFSMACVLVYKKDHFVVDACTDRILSNFTFTNNHFIERVLTGQPVAFFDINQIMEYKASGLTKKSGMISALHLPLDNGNNSTLLICFHQKRAFYNKNHLDLAKRFAPLASHALQTQRAKAKADMASKAKSEFLAVVSHEIRTPLNGVIGMNELMLETHLTEEQQTFAMTIKHSAESLLTIINDILDFSKIEAGKLTLEVIEVNLFHELTQTIQTILPMLNHSDVNLTVMIDQRIPKIIYCDPIRLKQVLLNMLSNACKFTTKGDIYFSCELANTHSNKHCKLLFSIEDTGIGIPETKKESIFDSFNQADISTTRKFGGTGLGLSITKRLIELMQGSIEINSQEGKGTEVKLSCECQLAKNIAETPLQHIDNKCFALFLKSARFGHWLKTALSLFKANVFLNPKSAPKYEIDVIIIDLSLNTNEIENLLNNYKCSTIFGYFVKIQDKIKCKNLTFHHFIQPPLFLESINNALTLKTQHQGNNTSLLSSQDKLFKRLRVLVVEDNLVNQMLLKTLLSKKGINVTVSSNGKEALAILDKNEFDLILMDMQMPEMDGIEATKAIRQNKSSSNHAIPIIALTANVQVSDKQKCFDAGMNDFLSKPVHWNAIEDKIKRCLTLI